MNKYGTTELVYSEFSGEAAQMLKRKQSDKIADDLLCHRIQETYCIS